jgi:hypothetical protein
MTRLAEAIGAGLLAGVAGTAALTSSSALEAKLRDRGSSSAPADAASKVLGVEPTDPARFSNLVHWSYGTGWGIARGVIALAGLRGPKATAAHFATVWGWSLVMLPALDVAPPVWQQPPQEVAIDALHHAVYATTTSAAYAVLA